MKLPITPPYPPMEATSVDEIPGTGSWQFEPKWDGFRCIAFRDGDEVYLQSKSGQPLARYFPEVVEALAKLRAKQFVLDGEIVVPVNGELSFDQLLQRIHPAATRIRKLAAEFPARFLVFDLLVDEKGKDLTGLALSERRVRLEAFGGKQFADRERIELSPATTERKVAEKWFGEAGHALDGIIAKDAAMPYRSGERDGMVKIKHVRTVECVVGGFRYGSKATSVIGSLLLGLYDDDGLLHHVGFCSAMSAAQKKALTPKIEKQKKSVDAGGGFTGRAPGGPSRWSTERSSEWEALKPELVVEVQYDHFTNGRFRHGTKFVRFRPEKSPRACTFEQVRKGGSKRRVA